MVKLSQSSGIKYSLYLLYSILIITASVLWQGNIGFNLSDEGFVWYGAQRVFFGEIPILNFASYDPGRYYWAAFFMWAFNDPGLMSLRYASAIFQVISLFIGLCVIFNSKPISRLVDFLYLGLVSITLAAWMYPLFRSYDTSISILTIGVLTYLLSKPLTNRFFITGIWLGITIFFGKNHGLYTLISIILSFFWIYSNGYKGIGLPKAILSITAGAFAGSLPLVFMFLLIPGFFSSYISGVQLLIEAKSTNLTLPIAWPWSYIGLNFEKIDIKKSLFSLFFFACFLYAAISTPFVFYKKIKKEFVPHSIISAAFVSIGYFHYVTSRCDIEHLAVSIFPFLIGFFCIVLQKAIFKKLLYAFFICVLSMFLMFPLQPGWKCWISKNCTELTVLSDLIMVDPSTAQIINLLIQLKAEYSPGERPFLVVPLLPAVYPIFLAKAPMWDVYPIVPRYSYFEKIELEALKASNLGFVIIFNVPLDGREELRYKNTHPYTYEYIITNFVPIMLNNSVEIYKARDMQTQ